jgi:threonine dehydratase
MESAIQLRDLYAARQRLQGKIRRTPLVHSPSLSKTVGTPVHLKLEHLQVTGSFKARGAGNAVARLPDSARDKGVVGVSTGNHGRGLAHAAREAGVRAVICMSHLVPENKVNAIRVLGAEVRIVGASQDEAQVEVDRLVADEGMTLLPPFDHLDVIAGQGTLGLELVEDLPQLDTVLVPLSGGGLISGIAVAVKAANPRARVIGLSMRRGAAMYQSIRAGQPVQVAEEKSLADSLGGGIGLDNRYTFGIVRELVDDILLLEEPRIAAGIRHAYREEHQVIEGGGAVGISALLDAMIEGPGVTAVVLSGGNIDMTQHLRIVSGENDG